MCGKREFGDYQTPVEFAQRVCDYLLLEKKVKPSVVIEPTCGVGSFLVSALSFNARGYIGVDINNEYCEYCRAHIIDSRVNIINADFFKLNMRALVSDYSDVLVIGNPPWVTNSTLSTLNSDNLPHKTNFKRLRGIDAITGASNFDICEYIMLRLISEFNGTNAVIAMLCKTSVARNVFRELSRNSVYYDYCEMLEFDAAKVFGINASACVFVIKLSDVYSGANKCDVYAFDDYAKLKHSYSFAHGQLYNSALMPSDGFEGRSCFEWRQGVKHDLSRIMELTYNEGVFINGYNEIVDIEDTLIYPLVKSSMFKAPVIDGSNKYVIVTQSKARGDTAYIKQLAPKTWRYLQANFNAFENRKSSIYNGAPPFSMFGVGDYSYSTYKVGVSGFYKNPMFSVLYSRGLKPVMTDDTSYFICFSDYDMAYVAMLLLNSERVRAYLKRIAFLDAKRPYTKRVLERLSFDMMIAAIDISELRRIESALRLSEHVTSQMYTDFKALSVFHKVEQIDMFPKTTPTGAQLPLPPVASGLG